MERTDWMSDVVCHKLSINKDINIVSFIQYQPKPRQKQIK